MPSLSLMEMLPYLRCPASGGPLHLRDSHLESESAERFPVIDGVPYLIRPDNDLFDVDEVARGALASERKSSRQAPLRRIVAGLVPRETRNVGVSRYLAEFQASVASRDRRPRILVVGGAVIGAGLHAFVDDPGFDLVETDVYVGPRTRVVCDGRDLPFSDGAFDGAICQAVLQHVVDPQRVVDELHRVLAPNGVVYSDAPFMAQVHGGAFDFNRFSMLGHRLLYRSFDELAGGISCGPGTALAWSIRSFLVALLARSQRSATLVRRASRFLTWWLPLFDGRLLDAPGAPDAALGTIFIGTRRDTPLTHREIIKQYRGLAETPGSYSTAA